MILERLELENFGPYAGTQALDLAPPSEDRPVVLIGGLNGGGKTTLLEAILHALYGPLAGPLEGRQGSYEAFLKRARHRQSRSSDETAVDLTFRVVRAGEHEQLRIRRSWRRQGARMAQRIAVWRNGEPDAALAEGWIEFIEAVVPRGVARLFFFDGEKVEQLADLSRAQETLRTAVGSLLGLDLVDQLANDLRALERRNAASAASGEEQEGIRVAEDAHAQSERRVSELAADLAKARAIHDSASRAVAAADELFRSQGGEIFEQAQALEERERAASLAVAEAEEELRRIAAGATPLLLVTAELEEVITEAAAAGRHSTDVAVVELLAVRDEEVLQELRRSGVAEDIIDVVRKLLSRDRSIRAPKAHDGETGLTLSDGSRAMAEHVLRVLLPQLIDQLRAAHGRLDEARAAKEEVERLLVQLPSQDAISFAREQREIAKAGVAEADGRVRALDEQLERAKVERERRKTAHERALEKAVRSDFADEDSRRLVEHSGRVRATLSQLHVLAVARHIGRIETLVSDALSALLRKSGLVGGISIDPETFTMQLRDRGGNELPPERLSAGERQIVALALLWGLAKAAGRPLPVVIDTPLGRLDSSHRHLVVERYLPHASHQVLVLSTDTEIQGRVLQALGPYVGHNYLLSYDETSDATIVERAYFAAEAAA